MTSTRTSPRPEAPASAEALWRRASGFSLVEVLVVTAIIALLASIALPVVSTTRSSANRTECIANIRQIGTAFRAYMDDWDNTYPAAWNEWHTQRYAASGPYPRQDPGIVETLLPYGATPALWRCPADTGLDLHFSDYWMARPSRPFWQTGGSSYYYRDLQDLQLTPAYPDPQNRGLAMRRASVVTRPERVVLLMDVLPWHSRPQRDESYWTHQGMTVALYCDGHAAARPWAEVRENIQQSPADTGSLLPG